MWINKTDQKRHACWLGNRLKTSSIRGGGPLGCNYPRERPWTRVVAVEVGEDPRYTVLLSEWVS